MDLLTYTLANHPETLWIAALLAGLIACALAYTIAGEREYRAFRRAMKRHERRSRILGAQRVARRDARSSRKG